MTKIKSRALRIGAVILAAILGLMILFALFDWNMLRPYINRKVSETTGREFAIQGDLDVKFHRGLDTEKGWRRYVPRPYVSAENIRMGNPAWSTVGKDMATARRVDMGFRILPLLSKDFIITDLRLDAPSAALQRRKDGSNSWTLKDNGPSEWNVDIQRLAFSSASLRYLDEAINMDLRADAKSLANAQPYGLAFTLGGRYRQAPITGGGKAGAVLTLTDPDTTFPVEANADLGGNKVSVKGTLSDPKSLSGLDLRLKLGGPSMAELYPLTGVLLPETPPYETHGRLIGKKNDADAWTFTYEKFSGKVGASDIAGTLAYSQRKPRPLLRGELTSQQLRLADLGPSVGADTGAGTKQAGTVKSPPAGKALPVNEFKTEKWDALDADVKFTGKRIVRTNDIPLQDLVANIHMKDKVLKLTPLNFGMAGGRITSNISLDGRDKTIDAQARLAARHLKINRLFPKLESMRGSFGEINGDAALAGKGNTVASMLATSNGELNAVVTEGSVSQFMLELAGLNVANAIFVKVFGDKQIQMNCLAAEAAVHNGRANVQRFVLDTDEAVVDVTGYVDLAQEQLNLDVRPKTKGTRIFSLRTPLYAKGTFANPDVGPYKGPLAMKAGAAVALATVSPLAAVLPLVNVTKVPDTDCAAAIREAEKKPQMREAPKADARK
ncbi:AsmA family protein [Massilia sp. METH4]|uniref:AsmA family protein n=1 Tax=Massilia sp. METH4 TaxID=3123041 RepID=UPI0030CE1353